MRKRGRPPYPDILTPREWEVLALVREGLTNEQIAERLNITIHAARYHVSEILSKLGVGSRRDAAAWQPERAKSLWMGALAFLFWPAKHLPFGVAAKASVAAVAIATAGGIGFLAWGVVVTGGPASSLVCDLDDDECVQPIAVEVMENASCDLQDDDCPQQVAEELGRRLGCELTDELCVAPVGIALTKTGKMPGNWYIGHTIVPTPTIPPERDALAKEIAFGAEAIQAVVAGREEGRDYWIIVSHIYGHGGVPHVGETPLAMVDFYFEVPVSYTGEVPTIVFDPCDSQLDDSGNLIDPDDPCQDEPREYGTRHLEFTNEYHVTAEVDFRRGEVVDLFGNGVSSKADVEMAIEFAKEQYGQ